MGALQELLQTDGAGSSAAERTGGHGEEQISVLGFWVVGYVCLGVLCVCGFYLFICLFVFGFFSLVFLF